ncbi:MAG: 3-oxoacyl-ACP reductase [Actinobacteria bacterium]|nr:3-oxoacyl-ACP reductase [Actinomycetota bacterium]
MGDWYQQLTSHPLGRQATSLLGLPGPAQLRRGDDPPPGPVLAGDAGKGRLGAHLRRVLGDLHLPLRWPGDEATGAAEDDNACLVLDATGLAEPADLLSLHTFFHEPVRRLAPSGRVVVFGGVPAEASSPAERAAQHALTGFVRSLAKELRGGATANLVQVARDAEGGLDSTLRFLLSGRSAFVDAQTIPITRSATDASDRSRPQADRVALVTGAARGIGAAIARTLAADGAHVVLLDLPAQGDRLTESANRLGGSAMQLDITDAAAPTRLADRIAERHGRLDVLVHNAGSTRDKTIAGMDAAAWETVMAVNLSAPLRLTEALLDRELLSPTGRIVAVSSLSGIAGNRGQTNYAASKAGLIGLVDALAGQVGGEATANAVAPGFIETDMTAAMPFALRELGRRLNSLNQGGQPVDVAETVAWLAEPGSGGVNGAVVRVCGQSLLGA